MPQHVSYIAKHSHSSVGLSFDFLDPLLPRLSVRIEYDEECAEAYVEWCLADAEGQMGPWVEREVKVLLQWKSDHNEGALQSYHLSL